jgi:type III restriction enzyme
MMLQLKHYQEQALETLALYLKECDRRADPNTAFYETTLRTWGEGIPYRPITQPSELSGIPYVCLRIPTGGGKTLLACHAVAVANRDYLGMENSLVLWLVPSNAIKEQTLNALRDLQHPYRQALETTLGRVEVLDLSEALSVQAGMLQGNTTIIVATLQAFRVEEKEGRKVYESAGALQHHFTDLSEVLKNGLELDENGVLPYSLSNVLRLHRPLVIVDEAHNARTKLSFDTLARFRPSAIIEFTATPDSESNPSNVLHSVSAAELKAEEMIKLPIRLEAKNSWESLLGDAIALRDSLEENAKIESRKTGDYIRPIMLLQAQSHRQGHATLDVEAVKKALLENHQIPENQVVIATGDQRGLEGVDLKNDKCEIRFIITMQALREGWDCSFAYILFSVAEQSAVTAVEQLLGRILRLPYAKTRVEKDLNKAYAFVTSSRFSEAAQSLEDALVENGFQRQEARDLIQYPEDEQTALRIDPITRSIPKKAITVQVAVDPAKIPVALKSVVSVESDCKTLILTRPLSSEEFKTMEPVFADTKDIRSTEEKIVQYRMEVKAIFESPAERGYVFKVPLLCIKEGQELLPFGEDVLLEKGWRLLDCDPVLCGSEWDVLREEGGSYGEVDVTTEGKVVLQTLPELMSQLRLISVVENWTESQLIAWLARNLPFMDVTPDEKERFLALLVGDLSGRKQMKLAELVRKKFEILKLADFKIRNCRKKGLQKAYQEVLFGDGADKAVVGPDRVFEYGPDRYPARSVCIASHLFRKHYYPKVGEMSDRGEEFECARYLDSLESVEYWVRNLERQPEFSFWLQTSTDKFYPDFVCKLRDGRILVVEYKGGDRYSNDDSKEKRILGELWATHSSGICLFVMTNGPDWADSIGGLFRGKKT